MHAYVSDFIINIPVVWDLWGKDRHFKKDLTHFKVTVGSSLWQLATKKPVLMHLREIWGQSLSLLAFDAANWLEQAGTSKYFT